MKKATIIIPTYNEVKTIQKTLEKTFDVIKTVKGWQISILIVDDTSPDKTYELVEKLQKKYKQLYLVLNKQKAGLGGAYLKGMEYAFTKLKANVVFEFDADLSHDPTKIPLMLEEIDKGADMVLGSRYMPGGGIPQDWGLHRKFLSVVGNLVIATVLTDFRIKDWTGGFRAIRKPVYEAVVTEMKSERFSGYTFQIGFLHKAVRKNFTIVEIPFRFVDRTEGESKLGSEYIKNTLIYIGKVRMLEILQSRFFKFAMVGGMGAAIQLGSLQFFWRNVITNFDLAFFLAIETAILSNFILNNLWTFKDRQLTVAQAPLKFLQFNLASGGSIVIQQIIGSGGKFLFGLPIILALPAYGISVDAGPLYAVIGILVGMFWNYFAYNFFIWNKASK